MSYDPSFGATNCPTVHNGMLNPELVELLEENHRAGFCWALACCNRNPHEAEDVLQTVYVKILDGRARFRGESSFRTWFFAVIRLTAADRRRRAAVRQVLTLRLAAHGRDVEPFENPDESVFANETRDAFRRALATLARRQREALELVFYHDMTIEQAAAVMSVTVGSARQHYERGKKRLRMALEASEVSYVAEWQRRARAEELS